MYDEKAGREYGYNYTKVVGTSRENEGGTSRQELIEYYAEPNLELRLVRDRDNEVDPNAIAVYLDEHQLGFLPKELAAEYAPRFKGKQAPIQAFIVEVTGGPEDGKEYFGVNVKWRENGKGLPAGRDGDKESVQRGLIWMAILAVFFYLLFLMITY